MRGAATLVTKDRQWAQKIRILTALF